MDCSHKDIFLKRHILNKTDSKNDKDGIATYSVRALMIEHVHILNLD